MAKKPAKRAPRKATRGQILRAARAELVKGDGDLELARVAKRAGVSDGLTYYHFGNKAGLIQALVHEFFSAMDDQVTAVPFEGKTWAERVALSTSPAIPLRDAQNEIWAFVARAAGMPA